MTKQEALRYFRKHILPFLDSTDRTAVRTAWNNWTDSLQRDGQITLRQYETWVGPPERKTRSAVRRDQRRNTKSQRDTPACRGPTGTQVQSVILSQQFFSLREAEDWILSHDFRVSKIDESRNFWRFRQQPPTWFKKGTFRTIRLRPGVEAIVGCPL